MTQKMNAAASLWIGSSYPVAVFVAVTTFRRKLRKRLELHVVSKKKRFIIFGKHKIRHILN